MKNLIAVAAIAFSLAGSHAALGSNLKDCTEVDKAQWKTTEEIAALAKSAGYEVRKVEVEGTCYEVYAVGSDGTLMELYYNPATSELVKSEKKS